MRDSASSADRDSNVSDVSRLLDNFQLEEDSKETSTLIGSKEGHARVPDISLASVRHGDNMLLEPIPASLSLIEHRFDRSSTANVAFPSSGPTASAKESQEVQLPLAPQVFDLTCNGRTFGTDAHHFDRTVMAIDEKDITLHAPRDAFSIVETSIGGSAQSGRPTYAALTGIFGGAVPEGGSPPCHLRRSSTAPGGCPGSTGSSKAMHWACYGQPPVHPASFVSTPHDLRHFEQDLKTVGCTEGTPFPFVEEYPTEQKYYWARRHSVQTTGIGAFSEAANMSVLLDGQSGAAFPRIRDFRDAQLLGQGHSTLASSIRRGRGLSVDLGIPTATEAAVLSSPTAPASALSTPTAAGFAERLLSTPLLYNAVLGSAAPSGGQVHLPQGTLRFTGSNDQAVTQAISPTTASGVAAKDPKKLALYKTELCRSFGETGTCRYGGKCQFAHGAEELRTVERHPKHKSVMCKTFWEKGSCPYGQRCCFIHTAVPSEHGLLSIQSRAVQSAVSSSSGSGSPSSVKSPLTPKDGIGKKRDSVSSISSLYAEESDAVNATINVSVESATKLVTRSNPDSPTKGDQAAPADESDQHRPRVRCATHNDADVSSIFSRRPSCGSFTDSVPCGICGSSEACTCTGTFVLPHDATSAGFQQLLPAVSSGRSRTVSASDAHVFRLAEQIHHRQSGNTKHQLNHAKTGRRASLAEGGVRRLPVFQSLQS